MFVGYVYAHTVKSVYKEHSRDEVRVGSIDRWCLCREVKDLGRGGGGEGGVPRGYMTDVYVLYLS